MHWAGPTRASGNTKVILDGSILPHSTVLQIHVFNGVGSPALDFILVSLIARSVVQRL